MLCWGLPRGRPHRYQLCPGVCGLRQVVFLLAPLCVLGSQLKHPPRRASSCSPRHSPAITALGGTSALHCPCRGQRKAASPRPGFLDSEVGSPVLAKVPSTERRGDFRMSVGLRLCRCRCLSQAASREHCPVSPAAKLWETGLCGVHGRTESPSPCVVRTAMCGCLRFSGGPRGGTGFLKVTKKLVPEKQRVLTSWRLYLFISGHEW